MKKYQKILWSILGALAVVCLGFTTGYTTFPDSVFINGQLNVTGVQSNANNIYADGSVTAGSFQKMAWNGASILQSGAGTKNINEVANGTGMLTNNGSGTFGWMAIPSGSGATALSNLTDVVVTNMFGGDFLQWNNGMQKWTNFPAFFSAVVYLTQTNVFVGTNLEQFATIKTNASFKLVYTGTPQNGESVNLSVSNYSASTIYMTNTAYDPIVASNVTVFAIPGTSIRDFKFVSSTNFNLGVQRWELIRSLQKEAELNVAGQSLALLTNAATSIVTISNAYNSAVQTVSGAGNGSTNYLITLSTNSINDFYLGSSNVNIYQIAGGREGTPVYWNAIVTNLSGNTWGITFAASGTTNHWHFAGTYGTNAPSVLTNNTRLMLSGRTDGTNTMIGYSYFAPGL
jgi:hypothetical protein